MKLDALHSALDPAGPQAGRINTLWWFLFFVAAAVFVAFVIAMAISIRRGRRNAPPDDASRAAGAGIWTRVAEVPPEPHPEPGRERRLGRAVAVATGVSALILIAFLVANYLTGRGIATIVGPQPLVIKITGHQWWWDVEYEVEQPHLRVRTANEIHIPVGRPVVFRLYSSDVIHSFWVPNLHGKRDLTPGYVAVTWLQADKPGVYRGICAEFCGHQHAKMAFEVVAEPPEEFERWYARALRPAQPATDALAKRGETIVVHGPCAMCHAVLGTPAGSRFGPDLTHVASRRTIAAGTLPTTRENLARWIADPQAIKPGVRMPLTALSREDIAAVVAYLESLK